MPYDPTLPANNSPVSSEELRNQFAGLQELIEERVPLYDLDGYMAGFCAGIIPAPLVPLNLTISNPPTQAQVQAIANLLDQVLTSLRRE